MKITEVNIVPIRSRDGLIAFASCIVDDSLFLGSIAVHTRPLGGYRLVFPTKTIGNTELNVFNPITKSAGIAINKAIAEKCDEIFGKCDEENKRNDGHNQTNLSM